MLITKAPAKGSQVSNYLPVGCLPIIRTLLTGIIEGTLHTSGKKWIAEMDRTEGSSKETPYLHYSLL